MAGMAIPARSSWHLEEGQIQGSLADRLESRESSPIGQAWSTAALSNREPEHQLCTQVSGRACTTPTPHALAAVAALARIAPAADISTLTGTIDILTQTQPLPSWATDAAAWTPLAAWRAVDIYDSDGSYSSTTTDPNRTR